MFGRLAAVQLKTAEQALHDGRVDEAFELATARESSGNRRMQRILAGCFERLMDRAQNHLLSGRFREALLDLDKADRCNVDGPKVAEWRQRAINALDQHNQRNHEQRRALDAAADRLAHGALTMASNELKIVPNGHAEKAHIAQHIAIKSEQARQAVEDARVALRNEQFALAADRLIAARQQHAAAPDVLELSDHLLRRLMSRIAEALASGRLDRASHELDLARRIDPAHPEITTLARTLNWAIDAGTAIRQARYDDARALMNKLTQVVDEARWARDTIKCLDEIQVNLDSLSRGPLGLLASGPGIGRSAAVSDQTVTLHGADTPAAAVVPARPERPKARSPAAPPPLITGGLPRRLVLRMDGVGSFLLLRSDRITIGRAGASADFPIMADLSEVHAEIHRTGDDYFVVSSAGVELGGRAVQQALLSSGDRLRIGRRVRLTYERPSRKSPAATLTLGEGVRSVSDVRRAILWSGPILIGPTTDSHIVLRGGMPGIVLLERAGSVYVRPMPGSPESGLKGPTPVQIGEPMEIAGLRFSLQQFSEMRIA